MHGTRYRYYLGRSDLDFDLSLDLDLYFGGQKIKIVITQSFSIDPHGVWVDSPSHDVCKFSVYVAFNFGGLVTTKILSNSVHRGRHFSERNFQLNSS